MNFIYDSNEIEYRKLEARLRQPRIVRALRSLKQIALVLVTVGR